MDKNTENTAFHVHDVLDMLQTVTTPLTTNEIQSMITEKFSASARFHSCSMDSMTPDAVVSFLVARNKIVEAQPGKFVLNSHGKCNH